MPQRVLPLVVVKRLETMTEPAAAYLRAGVLNHLRADAAFHRHAEFERRVREVTPRVAALWPQFRHATMAAHILVEMMLDRFLLQRDGQMAERYYANFAEPVVARASELAGDSEPKQKDMLAVLQRFVSWGFLRDYLRAEGLAYRFTRMLTRTRMAAGTEPDPQGMTELVEQLSLELCAGSEGLLEDVRRSTMQWPAR